MTLRVIWLWLRLFADATRQAPVRLPCTSSTEFPASQPLNHRYRI